MAFSRTNARRALAAWDEGIAFVHEHRIGFFEGFIARDAARMHTSDGEPDVALGLFAEAIPPVSMLKVNGLRPLCETILR